MRAWTVAEYGHYKSVLTLSDQPSPIPEGETTRIAVQAAGVMFADLLNIAGQYQVRAPLPFVPGSEASGVVTECGSQSRFKPGDRVVTVNLMGAFAEEMLAVDDTTFLISDAMTAVDAAALTINYQTAHFALAYRGRLKAGEWLLVHGGAGGVGSAAIQLGKVLGANVIATAGHEDKCRVCAECGADHVINYSNTDFVSQVKAITRGNGADVILDPVGGDVLEKSVKCIAHEGRLLVIGFAGGTIPSIPANRVLLKNMEVIGVYWGAYQTRDTARIRDTQHTLYRLYDERKIKPVIYREFPLDDLPSALEAIENRACHGKAVMVNA
ncbi:MAG: oxidoreductase [Candidatus Hydrogenedentota bacterium]